MWKSDINNNLKESEENSAQSMWKWKKYENENEENEERKSIWK